MGLNFENVFGAVVVLGCCVESGFVVVVVVFAVGVAVGEGEPVCGRDCWICCSCISRCSFMLSMPPLLLFVLTAIVGAVCVSCGSAGISIAGVTGAIGVDTGFVRVAGAAGVVGVAGARIGVFEVASGSVGVGVICLFSPRESDLAGVSVENRSS